MLEYVTHEVEIFSTRTKLHAILRHIEVCSLPVNAIGLIISVVTMVTSLFKDKTMLTKVN